ncbi:MAG: RNA polymerase sigma factor [Bacteroidales bacterium]
MIIKDDNELVHEVISGNNSSFELLIDRYQKTVFNMVLRMVGDTENAKDITQDIFLKAYEKLHTFKFNYKFFSWLYRISINETINWIKKNPRLDQLDRVQIEPAEDSDAEEAKGQAINKVQYGLMILPENSRSLLVLKYYCSLSYEEIAEVKGISVKKVRSRLFSAREQLRKILETNGL